MKLSRAVLLGFMLVANLLAERLWGGTENLFNPSTRGWVIYCLFASFQNQTWIAGFNNSNNGQESGFLKYSIWISNCSTSVQLNLTWEILIIIIRMVPIRTRFISVLNSFKIFDECDLQHDILAHLLYWKRSNPFDSKLLTSTIGCCLLEDKALTQNFSNWVQIFVLTGIGLKVYVSVIQISSAEVLVEAKPPVHSDDYYLPIQDFIACGQVEAFGSCPFASDYRYCQAW